MTQETDAVHLRHLDIQGKHIRIQFLDLAARHLGVHGRADDFDLRIRVQDLG
ncbi:hypothetical protein D3C83_200240 [compost metagenome]